MNNVDKVTNKLLINTGTVLLLIMILLTFMPNVDISKLKNETYDPNLNPGWTGTYTDDTEDSLTHRVWSLECSCDCSRQTDLGARNCELEVGGGYSGTFSNYTDAAMASDAYYSDCNLRGGVLSGCSPTLVETTIPISEIDSSKLSLKLTLNPNYVLGKRSVTITNADGTKKIEQNRYYEVGTKITATSKLSPSILDITGKVKWNTAGTNCTTSSDTLTNTCTYGYSGVSSLINASFDYESSTIKGGASFLVVKPITKLGSVTLNGVNTCDYGRGTNDKCETISTYDKTKGFDLNKIGMAIIDYDPYDANEPIYWYIKSGSSISLLYSENCNTWSSYTSDSCKIPDTLAKTADSRIQYFKTVSNGTTVLCANGDAFYNVERCVSVNVGTGANDPLNPGTPATSIKVGQLGIKSSNANKYFAKLNDTITLDITTTAATTKPTVTIAGVNATVTGSGVSFKATTKVTSKMSDGLVSFKVKLNDGSTYSNTTNGSFINIFKNGLGMTQVSIKSNYFKGTTAYEGSIITLDMVATEELAVAPTVTIGGVSAKVSGSGKSYKAYVTVNSEMSAGTLPISISGYQSMGGTVGNTITKTTDGSSVIYVRSSLSPSSSTKSVKVTSVSLNKEYIYLKPGESEQMSVTILPSDATNKTIAWHSSDNSIATVDTEGLIKAISEGKTLVKVTTSDGRFVAEVIVIISTVEHTYSSDSSLKDIIISDYDLDFESDVYAYDLKIKKDVDSLVISPLVSDSSARYTILDNSNLTNGSVINIKVTAEDYSETTYTINITKDVRKSNAGLVIFIVILVLALLAGVYFLFRKKKQNTEF